MASTKKTGCNVKPTVLKVVLLGDGGVGKSCLMNRFVNNKFNADSYHTIGVEFLNKEMTIDGQNFVLQIWDTAGQERFRSLRTPFYRGSDICILTYSICDATSFKNLTMWKKEFLYYANIKDSINFPFLIIGNKMDVVPELRQVTREDLTQWVTNNSCPPFIETSAKDAINVQLAFTLAVENWMKMEKGVEKLNHNETVKLNNTTKNTSSFCCS